MVVKMKNKARPTLPPYWVSKMSPSLGLATLHSVKPPTEKGLPVATLINWLPDSDHFHSCLSDPVNDHISSLVGERYDKEGRSRGTYLSTPAWTTLPLVWKPSQMQSDLITKAGPEPAASFL